MRNILVDHARAHAAAKRGQGADALPLDEAKAVAHPTTPDFLALDDAMQDLAKFDERKSRMIELRYFGGLSMEEIARSHQSFRRDHSPRFADGGGLAGKTDEEAVRKVRSRRSSQFAVKKHTELPANYLICKLRTS